MKPEYFFVNPKDVSYAEYECVTIGHSSNHDEPYLENHKVFMYLKCGRTIDHQHDSKQSALDFIEWLQEENEIY